MFIYVIPFYLSPATRPSPTLTRDAPSSIRARTRAVTFSTLVCLAITSFVLYKHHVSAADTFQLLGLWPMSLSDILRTMVLVTILFIGPLFEQGIVDGGLKDWVRLNGVYESLSSWIGYRNYIVVCQAPTPRYTVLTTPGPCQRRARLAIMHYSSPCPRSLLWKANCVSNPTVLRHCSSSPPL